MHQSRPCIHCLLQRGSRHWEGAATWQRTLGTGQRAVGHADKQRQGGRAISQTHLMMAATEAAQRAHGHAGERAQVHQSKYKRGAHCRGAVKTLP